MRLVTRLAARPAELHGKRYVMGGRKQDVTSFMGGNACDIAVECALEQEAGANKPEAYFIKFSCFADACVQGDFHT